MKKDRTVRDQNSEYMFGINPITTLLQVNSGHRKIHGIYVSEHRKKDRRLERIRKLAADKNIGVSLIPGPDFRDMVQDRSDKHNITAHVSPYNPSDLDLFLRDGIKPASRLMVLDGVTDVGNFGSIIRNCNAFGFDGIVIAKKRSVPLSGDVSRISAGGLEAVSIFRVPNLVMAIKKLKARNFWIYGTTLERAGKVQDLALTDFIFPMALVMGSEDRGMGRLVADNCDVLISIDLTGKMQSLNVSVASGIILYRIQEKYRGMKD